MTVAAVRAELVTKLKTVDPISGRSFSFAPESLEPPCAFVGTMTYDPRATFDRPSMTAQVWLAVSNAASTSRAVDAIDTYIDGDNAIPDALEATATAWDSLAVTNIEFPITIEVGAGAYTAARFDCELYL